MVLLVMILNALIFTDVRADDDWQLSDDDLESRISGINEGVLEFFSKPPEQPVHHHTNRIEIIPASLDNGWVKLEQCHTHLDPVGLLEITYHPDRIRDIYILSSRNIGTIQVKGAGVELTEIGTGAILCLLAESKALVILSEDGYRLRNGPYMRRFLDGYYPMRVTLEIKYPESLISLKDYEPQPGESGSIVLTPGFIRWDAWFQGRLFTEFNFIPRP